MCMRCGKHTPVECPEGGPAAELQRECCCRCREKRSWRKALRLKSERREQERKTLRFSFGS